MFPGNSKHTSDISYGNKRCCIDVLNILNFILAGVACRISFYGLLILVTRKLKI